MNNRLEIASRILVSGRRRVDLDKLEAACRAGSDAPWKQKNCQVLEVLDMQVADVTDKADATLIPLLRNSAPALIAELRAARRVVEAARKAITPAGAELACYDIDRALVAYDAATGAGGEEKP